MWIAAKDVSCKGSCIREGDRHSKLLVSLKSERGVVWHVQALLREEGGDDVYHIWKFLCIQEIEEL